LPTLINIGSWGDEDFVDCTRAMDAPVLPAQLAMFCVLQFLLDLSDQQTVESIHAGHAR
jgi:hypothetical protein